MQSSSSRTSPGDGRRDDLVGSFDALALAGKPKSKVTRTTESASTSPFVGGFALPADGTPQGHPPTRNVLSKRPNGPSFPIAQTSPGPLPIPPILRGPTSQVPDVHTKPRYSLTMRHALNLPSFMKPKSKASGMQPLSPSPIPSPSQIQSDLLRVPIPRPPSTLSTPSSATSTSSSPGPPRVLSPHPIAPKRPRAASTPPSPTISTVSGTRCRDRDAVQCSGVTKAGKRCTRHVKLSDIYLALAGDTESNADADIEAFCHQHRKEVLTPSGFYSRKTGEWVNFIDWIPDYLQPDTQAALRVEMEKAKSQSDVPGYIYTFEIRDPLRPQTLELKIGRAVNLVKRLDQWGKQCTSKEQVLRGWWPGSVVADESLMKGRVRAGDKGALCHRLERLVHLEVADLAAYVPYLDPDFPNPKAHTGGQLTTSKKGRLSLSSVKKMDKSCADCGAMHKEIFSFSRVQEGKYKGKEWDLIVKPVIEKWGGFVDGYV